MYASGGSVNSLSSTAPMYASGGRVNSLSPRVKTSVGNFFMSEQSFTPPLSNISESCSITSLGGVSKEVPVSIMAPQDGSQALNDPAEEPLSAKVVIFVAQKSLPNTGTETKAVSWLR